MSSPKYAKPIIVTRTTDQVFPFRFNYDFYVTIAINKYVPNSKAVEAAIVDNLNRRSILDMVVFEPFEASINTLQVELGRRVPVDILQDVVRACVTNGLTSVAYSINEDDGRFGYTQRIYIGSISKVKGVQLTSGQLKDLLKEGIDQRDFMRMIAPTIFSQALEPVYVIIMDVPPSTPQAVFAESLIDLMREGTVEVPDDPTHIQMLYMTLPQIAHVFGNKSALDALSVKALQHALADYPKFREYVDETGHGYVLKGITMTSICAKTEAGHNAVVVQIKQEA
ncbi:MAG: hypothetical protein WA821_14910 [Anaerolineales bacterium]